MNYLKYVQLYTFAYTETEHDLLERIVTLEDDIMKRSDLT